jgi:hypothetical protein
MGLLGKDLRWRTVNLLQSGQVRFLMGRRTNVLAELLDSVVMEARCRRLCLLVQHLQHQLLGLMGNAVEELEFVTNLSYMRILMGMREFPGELGAFPPAWHGAQQVMDYFGQPPLFLWNDRGLEEPELLRVERVSAARRTFCDLSCHQQLLSLFVDEASDPADIVMGLSIIAVLRFPVWYSGEREWAVEVVLGLPFIREVRFLITDGVGYADALLDAIFDGHPGIAVRSGELKRMSRQVFDAWLRFDPLRLRESTLNLVLLEERWRLLIDVMFDMHVKAIRGLRDAVSRMALDRLRFATFAEMLQRMRGVTSDADFHRWEELNGLPFLGEPEPIVAFIDLADDGAYDLDLPVVAVAGYLDVGIVGVPGDVVPVAAVIVQDVLMADIEVINLADDEDAVEVVGNAVYMNAAPVDWLL